jgi:hypothetical protein
LARTPRETIGSAAMTVIRLEGGMNADAVRFYGHGARFGAVFCISYPESDGTIHLAFRPIAA